MDPASAAVFVFHSPDDPWSPSSYLSRASIYLSHVIKSCQGPDWPGCSAHEELRAGTWDILSVMIITH